MLRFIPAALAASIMIAAAPAAAQTSAIMTAEEARAQMQQYCAQTAQRTDEAGRSYYATYCSPAAMAQYDRRVVDPRAATVAAVGFLAAVLAIAIL